MKQFIILLLACWFATGEMASVAKPGCGGSTSSKNIQLLTPNNPPRQCKYHINAYSGNVCQLRIDFAMTLAQPTVPSMSNTLNYVQCVDDYFQVNGLRFCGTETHQHIYVPFNRTAGVTSVELAIILAARTGYGLPKATWDMKIKQLECPSGAAIRSFDAGESFVPEARASSINDGFFVAPPGCLQYFPHAAGLVTSFNYNNGQGVYPGQLNYAICFRRQTHTQSLEINTNYFNLGAEPKNTNNLEMDNLCYSHSRVSGVSDDYLLIPQATVLRSNIRATYFCGTSLQSETLRSTNPGPLSIIFNSDSIYKVGRELGFSFTYRVI